MKNTQQCAVVVGGGGGGAGYLINDESYVIYSSVIVFEEWSGSGLTERIIYLSYSPLYVRGEQNFERKIHDKRTVNARSANGKWKKKRCFINCTRLIYLYQ